MKRAFACSLLALTGVAVAAPSANPPPDKIAPRVRISGVRVGGLTAEPARARIRAAFDRALRFQLKGKRWGAKPATLGASTSVDDAVSRALRVRPRARVALRVKIDRERLLQYVESLDRKLSEPAEDAQVIGLSSALTPMLSDSRAGFQVDRAEMMDRIVHELKTLKRKPVPLAVDRVEPAITKENFGPVIVIRRDSHQLYLYDGEQPWRSFPVATGQAAYPTPTGSWHIVDMQVNPWWRPPASDWAAGQEPIPPGPGNPLGTRWMGLDAPAVGIHATPDAASVGYSASHGCIRMHVSDAEWLFEQVHVGTPVYIVAA